MREKNRNSIESNLKLPQFTTMNVIDGQAGLVIYSSLIFYSLTIDNILNIIVLLILAGVTIVTLTGDNGLLQKATTAKEKQDDAKELELIKLAVSAAQVAGEGNITKDNLENELKSNFDVDIINLDEKSGGWILNKNKEYTIYENGKVEEGNLLPLLPKEYQQVEYIECTGTQYIDTKMVANYNSKIQINCYIPFSSHTTEYKPFLFGARIRINKTPWSKNGIAISICNQGIRYDFGNITNNSYTYQQDERKDIIIDNTGGYCDGTKLIDFSNATFTDSEPSGNMLLGALLDTGATPGIRTGPVVKIYFCKIWNGVQLIRNFIPCYSTTTVTDVDGTERPKDTIGLYDTVNGQFYVNKGTGTFGYGMEDGTYVAPTNN